VNTLGGKIQRLTQKNQAIKIEPKKKSFVSQCGVPQDKRSDLYKWSNTKPGGGRLKKEATERKNIRRRKEQRGNGRGQNHRRDRIIREWFQGGVKKEGGGRTKIASIAKKGRVLCSQERHEHLNEEGISGQDR